MATQNAQTPLEALRGAMKANVSKPKIQGIDGKFKASMIDAASSAVDMATPAIATATNMYGSDLTATTLTAALGGMKALGGGFGGSTPYMATGSGDPMSYLLNSGTGSTPNITGSTTGSDSAVDTASMIQMMNQNSLQLMELQAVMQNNMQLWNTRSNILSADHRVRMTMVEKLQAR